MSILLELRGGSNLTILGLGALCARLISLSPLIQGRFSIYLSQFRRRLPRFLQRSALQLLRPARAAVFSRCFDDNWWDWRGSSYRRRRSCQGIPLVRTYVHRTNIVFRARARTTTAFLARSFLPTFPSHLHNGNPLLPTKFNSASGILTPRSQPPWFIMTLNRRNNI